MTQETPADFNDRIITIKTSDAIKPDAKKPWRDIDFNGKIESRFLFLTALSKSILPFGLFKPDTIVLPITIEFDSYGKKEIKLHSANDIRREGYLNASKWFQDAENIWNTLKTENNANISSEDYINWQSKLTEQNLNNPFVVLYNTSGKDANSVVVNRNELPLEFLVDHKTYIFTTSIKEDAYYLSAILNSSIPNLLMKDFQSRGLFGARDVHKKILDIYYPKYNETTRVHKKLAKLSEQAHEKTKQYLIDNAPKQAVAASVLGRLRTAIKKHLKDEMEQIDDLVKGLIA